MTMVTMILIMITQDSGLMGKAMHQDSTVQKPINANLRFLANQGFCLASCEKYFFNSTSIFKVKMSSIQNLRAKIF